MKKKKLPNDSGDLEMTEAKDKEKENALQIQKLKSENEI